MDASRRERHAAMAGDHYVSSPTAFFSSRAVDGACPERNSPKELLSATPAKVFNPGSGPGQAFGGNCFGAKEKPALLSKAGQCLDDTVCPALDGGNSRSLTASDRTRMDCGSSLPLLEAGTDRYPRLVMWSAAACSRSRLCHRESAAWAAIQFRHVLVRPCEADGLPS